MVDIFSETVQKLADAKIANPRLEARLMIAGILECEPAEIYTGITLSDENIVALNNMLNERLNHKPLDKILGHREFYKYDFAVNEDVLSPRPDTEILVEEALQILQKKPDAHILDLGCGSGCIIETLLKEFPASKGCAVDISNKALKVAEENAVNLGVDARLQFIKADWFDDNFMAVFDNKFDMIVSNPPYIPSDDIKELQPEVKNYDPLSALDGGKSGFDSYERIAQTAFELLPKDGYILLEAGFGQARQIADIYTARGFKLVKIVNDLAGIARCVILQKSVAESEKS